MANLNKSYICGVLMYQYFLGTLIAGRNFLLFTKTFYFLNMTVFRLVTIILLSLFFYTASSAQTVMTNDKGEKIVFYPDGTWKYYKDVYPDSLSTNVKPLDAKAKKAIAEKERKEAEKAKKEAEKAKEQEKKEIAEKNKQAKALAEKQKKEAAKEKEKRAKEELAEKQAAREKAEKEKTAAAKAKEQEKKEIAEKNKQAKTLAEKQKKEADAAKKKQKAEEAAQKKAEKEKTAAAKTPEKTETTPVVKIDKDKKNNDAQIKAEAEKKKKAEEKAQKEAAEKEKAAKATEEKAKKELEKAKKELAEKEKNVKKAAEKQLKELEKEKKAIAEKEKKVTGNTPAKETDLFVTPPSDNSGTIKSLQPKKGKKKKEDKPATPKTDTQKDTPKTEKPKTEDKKTNKNNGKSKKASAKDTVKPTVVKTETLPYPTEWKDPNKYRYSGSKSNTLTLHHPSLDESCTLAYDEKDEFTGRRRRATEPSTFFTYTKEDDKQVMKENPFLECLVNIAEDGGNQSLEFVFIIDSPYGRSEYGNLEEGAKITFMLLNGELLVFENVGKSDKGKITNNKTKYTATITLDSKDKKMLSKAEIDKVRVAWSVGYEDYEVYDVDFIARQIKCF